MRYHTLSVISILVIGPLSVLATPIASPWDDIRVKHNWNSVPKNWQNLGHPSADTTIDLHVTLKAQDENAMIDALNEVSSPGHPKYGVHLTKEQVAELVAPHPDVVKPFNAWLSHHGVLPSTVSTKHGGSWLTLSGIPVSRANSLLGASYQLYRHTLTNDTVLRTLSYGLPAALHAHVQTVVPTTHFSFPRTPREKPLMRPGEEAGALDKAVAGKLGTELSSRDSVVTPSLLRSVYRTADYVPAAGDRNVLGIITFHNDYASPVDLGLFMTEYRTDGTSAAFTDVNIGGGIFDSSNPSPGASLDIQYAEAMAYPTRLRYYGTGGSRTVDDSLVNWLNYMLSQTSVPQTVSLSYGLYEFGVPPDYAKYVCNLFAMLGARGVSVLFASGDNGVGVGNCLFDHDDSEPDGFLLIQFQPTFPSTCPWVTSVGGTAGMGPEVAASLSGGGFSAYFPRPSYQDNAVPTFLDDLGDQYVGFYNASGRGVPDISLQAIAYQFFLERRVGAMDGTGCSTPAAAGIISLLNDYLISNDRPPLGWLNPWLYGGGLAGLNDITSGSNPGCNTDGFSAIPGWDPVTGLGSLDFEKLERLLHDQHPNPANPEPTTR